MLNKVVACVLHERFRLFLTHEKHEGIVVKMMVHWLDLYPQYFGFRKQKGILMTKKLKDKVQEIVAIAQECPETFQQICFEVLLKNALGAEQPPNPSPTMEMGKDDVPEQEKKEPKSVVEGTANSQDDLSSADLHVKARRFLEKHDLSVDHLNQLFYKEGEAVLPLYDDLKTTRTSESQIRITLLQCLLNAIRTGDFQTTIEAVREEASTRKCYDKNNWSNNYTNNASLFDFVKYTKTLKTIALSEQGKTELADVIKELQ